MIWLGLAAVWFAAVVVALSIARAGRAAGAARPTEKVEAELRLSAYRAPDGRQPAAELSGYGPLLLKRLAVQSCRISGADKVALLAFEPESASFVPVAVHGADEQLVGERLSGRFEPFAELRRTGRALLAPAWRYPALATILPDARLAAVAPMFADGAVCGFLVAGSGGGAVAFGRAELRIVGRLAALASAAVEDTALHEQLDATIAGATASVTAALERHLALPGDLHFDLAPLASEMGRRLGLDRAALIELELAARLHRVGRLVSGVVDLDAHASAAADVLAGVPGLQAVAVVVEHMSERWDGRGRPDALARDRIPLASRILAACAAFERAASLGARGGLDVVQQRAGAEFDPVVVAALAAALRAPAGAAPAAVPEWGAKDAEPVLLRTG